VVLEVFPLDQLAFVVMVAMVAMVKRVILIVVFLVAPLVFLFLN